MRYIVPDDDVLEVGYQAENQRDQFAFPLDDFIEEYPGGWAMLLLQRPKDKDVIVANDTVMDGNSLVWTARDYELKDKGYMKAQIVYAVGNVVAKTKRYRFHIAESLITVTIDEDTFDNMVNTLATSAANVNTAIQEAYATLDEKVDAAEEAVTNAEAAQEAAETAQDAAETAQGKAETAQAAAETAQQLAEAAQTAAEEARTGAVTAETGAEDAKAAAETAKRNAETAQAKAEIAQSYAEAAQDATEVARADALSANSAAQAAKTAAEAARQRAEAARDTAVDEAATATSASIDANSAMAAAQNAQSNAEGYAGAAANSAARASTSETNANTDALKAEGYAVGKQNGTDATSGQPYYQDNAKYYAGVAESAKTDAVAAKDRAETVVEGIEDAGATQVAAVQAKGTEVLNSIPSDYTELTGDVDELKSAIVNKADIIVSSASGSIASFPDGADAPIKSLSVAIEPVQDLHGYDHPWPAGGGKNKFSPDGLDQLYYNSIGTPLISKKNVISDYIAVTPGVEYTFSINQSIYMLSVTEFDASKNWIKNNNRGNTDKCNVTLNSNTAFVRCAINKDNTTNMDIFTAVETYHPQLEEGSTATDYAPYENICPITGWTGANVTRTGKNLFGGDDLKSGIVATLPSATIDTINKTVTFKASAQVSGINDFIKGTVIFNENTQYTFIVTYSKNSGAYPNMRIFYTDGSVQDIESVSSTNTKETVATVSNRNKTVLFFGKTNKQGETTVYYNECGIFEGVLTAEDFASYAGQTYDINWESEAGTVYGGYIDPVKGELVVTHESARINDFDWSSISSPENHVFRAVYTGIISPKLPNSTSTPVNAIMDRYLVKNWENISSSDNGRFAIGPLTAPRFNIVDHRYSTVQTFLDDNETAQLIYELAEPQTYHLTPQEIRTLLGQNNIWADTGDIEDAEYPADTKLYIQNLTKPTEDDMTANVAITSGKFFMIGNRLFLATAAIASGGMIIPGTNCTELSLADALNNINA